MNPEINKSVYCIICNRNGRKYIGKCIDSVLACRDNKHIRIVVVDNASADGSVQFLRKSYPGVIVIANTENRGFSGGTNQGILSALKDNADVLWFLNNDTYVDPDVLSAVDGLKDPSVAAVGSKIYFAPGCEFHNDRYSKSDRGKVLWYAGGVIDWQNLLLSHRGVDEVDIGQYDATEDTDFISGCSFFIRADILRQTGFFDEKYFLYLEDADLSVRIQNSGQRTVYYPKSVVWHINAGSSGKPGNPLHEYYLTRNRILFGFRYASFRTKFALLREAVRIFITGNKYRRRAVKDAVTWRYGKSYEPK